MTREERAARITAWTWAAQILGVEAGPERILGLVEVTAHVRAENLKPALEAVIKSEPHGFLPSPGAVIAAALRIAERRELDRPKALSAGRAMGPYEHHRWMDSHNPDDWDTETWTAFNVRMGTDPGFVARVRETARQRHEWAAEQVAKQISGRRVAAGFAHDLRLEANRDAEREFPRPNPWENDWEMPQTSDPLSAIGSSAKRSASRLRSNRPPPKDSESLKAAREAYAAKVEREAEAEKGRAWS